MRLKTVFKSFLLLLVVFVLTHALKVPGTPRYFVEATGGQNILDLQPSSSAEETWQRLFAMGADGRALYQRTILTVDVVFPLAVLLFLLALFAARRAELSRGFQLALVAIPVAYFAFDLAENLSAWALLARFPARLDVVGEAIGVLSRAKRVAMVAALVLPHLVLVVALVRAWRVPPETAAP